MTIEENKKLIERYPFLMPRDIWTDEEFEDYDYSWINGVDELPVGWEKLFLQMCEDIREPLIEANFLEKFRFTEIKEKYGALRAYHNGAPEKVQRILDDYEFISQFVCEGCGAPATRQTAGWIGSWCDECVKEVGYVSDPIGFESTRRATEFRNGKSITVGYDCSGIWERLYK